MRIKNRSHSFLTGGWPDIFRTALLAVASFFSFHCTKSISSAPSSPINPELIVSTINPVSGPANSIVIISGVGFSSNPDENIVTLNGINCPLISSSREKLVIQIPPKSGSGQLTVSAKGAQVSGPVFTYQYKVSVTTLAGSGAGFLDGIGTSALFNYPYNICLDDRGNLYCADVRNNRIRKVAMDGTVSTVAGLGVGFADGIVANAKFNKPLSLCFNAGVLYVGDSGNFKIRQIDLSTNAVTTVAGLGIKGLKDTAAAAFAKFGEPWGICLDGNGNLIIADPSNYRLRMLSASSGISTFSGNVYGNAVGDLQSASFFFPVAICRDAKNNLFISDFGNCNIKKITPDGKVSILAGTTPGFRDGDASVAQFYFPAGICADKDGNVYVCDKGNNRIRKITPDGTVTTLAGSSPGLNDGDVNQALFNGPSGIAIADDYTIYVADSYNNRIRKIMRE